MTLDLYARVKVAYFLSHPIQYQSPLIRHLCEQGLDIHVVYGPLSSDFDVTDPELGREEAWDVPLLDGYHAEFIDSPFKFGPFGLFCLRSRIQTVIERLQPDVVWVHGWGDVFSVAAWNVAWQVRIPVLLRGESHLGCLHGGFIRRWLHRQILRRCFKTVYRFLAIGSANRKFYLHYGVSEDRIVSVPYAVDNERFSQSNTANEGEVAEWRQQLGIPASALVIGFFGKLKKSKRPDLVIRAVAAVASELPTDAHPWLLFVGDGPLRRQTEKLARNLYSERTSFLGFQNQSKLPALYGSIDLLLLTSDFEPWGLVVNEAMSAGRAVVVSDAAGSSHDLVVRDPETGTTFKSGSLESLKSAILPFVSDRARLKQAGENGVDHIKNWSFDQDAAGVRLALAAIPARPPSKPRARTGIVAAYLGVHQIFQMGAAAAEANRLDGFHCSLISFPHRWGAFLSRWMYIPSASPLGAESLPHDKVHEDPLPLLTQRLAEWWRKPKTTDPIHTNRWFGENVARRLSRYENTGIVIGGETCSLELFTSAKRLGMRCMLDCHGIPAHFLQAAIDQAADDFDLPSPRLLDSEAMSNRKSSERDLADILVLCSDLQRQIYTEAGQPTDKLRVVPLWVDSGFWHPVLSSEKPINTGRPLRVLFAGSGSLGKGLPYLLRAIDQVGGAGAELTLVGSIQPNMRAFVDAVRAPTRTITYCPRPELRAQYWNHDVLVLPSLGDSFGFVAVEAMACGLPVVVTDHCGAPVPDPTWRVPAFSTTDIVARLERYRLSTDELHADGQKAVEFAHQLTVRRYREAIRDIFEELAPMRSQQRE